MVYPHLGDCIHCKYFDCMLKTSSTLMIIIILIVTKNIIVLCNFLGDSVNDAVHWPMTSNSGVGTKSMLTTANYVSATVMQLNASTMTHLTHSLWTTIVVEVGCVWTVSIERQADSATRVRLASSGLMARA